MAKNRIVKNDIDTTVRNLSLKKEAPKSAFVLLILLYVIAYILITRTATSHDTVILLGIPFEASSFTGVFSSLSNICIICLVMLFKRPGYILSLVLIVSQFPMMYVNIFIRQNYRNIPGIFTNFLIILAITFIYLGNRQIGKYQNHIREQAVTDKITNLPNRFACSELMQDLHKHSEQFAVVSVDLNGFKSINETMGHETGDLVLKEVASRWKALADSFTTGTYDFVARNSGDEFILLISDFDSVADVEKTITAYKNELERKITIDDCDYYLTACFGYALFPEDSEIIEDLFQFSDSALHEEKKTGAGSRIARYDPDNITSESTLEIERTIRAAINDNSIFFNLQPQFDMDHKLRGFEALARIKDESGAMISPADFIPVAEKTGLVDRIDMRIFELGVGFIETVSKECSTDITLSVNISVRHLMKNSFVEDIKRVLSEHNVDPGIIEIEITESIMIDSAEKALQRIDEIKGLGLKVAIDDFGTGYSSLSYLNSLPSDILKIDKSFIDNMNLSDSSRQYVAMIISIGHILDLKVISEGVETSDQVEVLKKIGCDYVQGYVWGRPMPPEEAAALVLKDS